MARARAAADRIQAIVRGEELPEEPPGPVRPPEPDAPGVERPEKVGRWATLASWLLIALVVGALVIGGFALAGQGSSGVSGWLTH